MPQRVRAHVVPVDQLLFQVRVQLVERRPRVREFGVAARAPWWQLVRPQQREARPSRVEGGIDVEDAVALLPQKVGLACQLTRRGKFRDGFGWNV